MLHNFSIGINKLNFSLLIVLSSICYTLGVSEIKMSLTNDEIRHIASLARIALSDEEIESVFELINKRETLRGEKQFEEADKIRDQIAGLGISLIDHKNKTLWMKKEAIKSEKQ